MRSVKNEIDKNYITTSLDSLSSEHDNESYFGEDIYNMDKNNIENAYQNAEANCISGFCL
jgi:hypothetical protein